MKNNKKGFTLIELLVVIAIIGILATTLAPKLREQLAKAKDSKVIALLGGSRTVANIILMDKVIRDDAETISLTEIKEKLDKNSLTLFTGKTPSLSGQIMVGGSKSNVTSSQSYGGNVNLGIILDGFETLLATDISVAYTNENSTVNLFKSVRDGAEDYSSEGKLWSAY